MSEEPVRPASSPQPNRELLLAQALDACIEAEREVPGSAQEIIRRQPDWAQPELRRLVDLACSLDAASSNAIMSEDFRAAARGRLMQRISRDVDNAVLPRIGPTALPGTRLVAVPSTNGYHRPRPRRSRRWFWRGTACVVAAVLTTAATLTASASALPGEPLYGIKQAQEELGVRLASDDQARSLALLKRADARLDETTRLLQRGRADEAAQAAQRFDETVMRATATYVVNIDTATTAAPAAADLDSRLVQQQEQLQMLLQSAPEPARAGLREAFVATERSRALVADPVPVEKALGRSSRDTAVAAPALEQVPTVMPTRGPAPAPTAVVAVRHDEVVVRQPEPRNRDEERGANRGEDGNGQDAREDERPVVATAPNTPVVSTSNSSRGRGGPQVTVPVRDRDEEVERRGGDDDDVRGPTSVPTLLVRGGDDEQEAEVALRGTSNGHSGGGGGQGRDDEAPQPATVTRSTGRAVVETRSGRSGPDGDAAATNANSAKSNAQTPPATVATQNEREGGGRGSEARPAPTSPPPPAQVVRPAATATPIRAQRGNGGDERTNTGPTKPASGDNRGGSDRGGGGEH